jgi:hypothetical protein
VQLGPVVKKCVGFGACTVADMQQMRAEFEVQSWLVLHDFGQLVEQMPSQQISPALVEQSVEALHVFGQGEYVGFRQSPSLLRFGSMSFTVVQQISPEAVSHSELFAHDFGHSEGGRQMFWL